MYDQMLALDLDETTLNADGELTETTRRAIEDAIAAGVCVVVASGRSFLALPSIIRRFSGIRYAIVSNGAAVFEMATETRLRQLHLSPDTVAAVLRLIASEPTVIPEAGIDGQMYAPMRYVENPVAFQRSSYVTAYVQKTREPVRDMPGFIWTHRHEIESIDLICPDPDKTRPLAERVRREVPSVYVTSSVPQMAELANPEAGKANGLRFLAAREKISSKQIMACGNADNDVDMLKYAGLGVAVANASSACLAAADVITDAYGDDGVAKAIRNYLIKG